MSAAARRKGHGYELELCHKLKHLFPKVGTSRNHSRSRDAAGVDLVETGCLNVQAKAWKSAPSYHAVLSAMPDEPGQHNVIAHKRPHKGTVVILSLDDFLEIIERAEMGE